MLKGPRGRRMVVPLVSALLATLVVVAGIISWTEGRGPTASSGQEMGAPPAGAKSGKGEQVLTTVYTTGYTWFDNTPPGSARISNPRVHRRAGGTGTYTDPITLAVGHSRANGQDVLDLPDGTRVYVTHVRRYFVVEDTCGDGALPQTHGCHSLAGAPRGATLWVDLYVGGGAGDTRADVQGCAGRVTDGDGASLHTVILNPRPGYAVAGQSIFHDHQCTDLFPQRAVRAGG